MQHRVESAGGDLGRTKPTPIQKGTALLAAALARNPFAVLSVSTSGN